MSTFDAELYRAFHRSRGEAYRWFKALPSSAVDPQTNEADAAIDDDRDANNLIYAEQSLPAGAKALVTDTTRQVQDAQFALITVGVTQISVMPDESYLSRPDKIVLSDRRLKSTHTIKRDSAASGTLQDALQRPFVVTIDNVFDSARTYVAGTDYRLTTAANPLDVSRIEWLSGGTKPTTGHSYTVAYTYQPLYVHLDQNERVPRPDKNGTLMPQRVELTLEQVH